MKHGECASLSQGTEDFVDTGGGKLSGGTDRVKLLVNDRISDVAAFSRGRYHRAGVRRSGMLDETNSQGYLEHRVGWLDEDGVDAVWSGSDGWAVRWDRNLEWGKREGAKVGFGCGEDVGEPAKDVDQSGRWR